MGDPCGCVGAPTAAQVTTTLADRRAIVVPWCYVLRHGSI
jgi:hypothetical protein